MPLHVAFQVRVSPNGGCNFTFEIWILSGRQPVRPALIPCIWLTNGGDFKRVVQAVSIMRVLTAYAMNIRVRADIDTPPPMPSQLKRFHRLALAGRRVDILLPLTLHCHRPVLRHSELPHANLVLSLTRSPRGWLRPHEFDEPNSRIPPLMIDRQQRVGCRSSS